MLLVTVDNRIVQNQTQLTHTMNDTTLARNHRYMCLRLAPLSVLRAQLPGIPLPTYDAMRTLIPRNHRLDRV